MIIAPYFVLFIASIAWTSVAGIYQFQNLLQIKELKLDSRSFFTILIIQIIQVILTIILHIIRIMLQEVCSLMPLQYVPLTSVLECPFVMRKERKRRLQIGIHHVKRIQMQSSQMDLQKLIGEINEECL